MKKGSRNPESVLWESELCLLLVLQRSSSVTKAMGSMMEHLANATYGMFKTYTSSQTSESVLLFVCSVARYVHGLQMHVADSRLVEVCLTVHHEQLQCFIFVSSVK